MSRKNISDAQVVEAHIAYRDFYRKNPELPTKWPYDFLAEWTGEPFKVCYAAMERASDRDFIDYGISLRTAWPTPKGLELLKQLDPLKKEVK
jgi:hypothetical protein